MTPAARLAAAASVLDSIAQGNQPAETVLKAWGTANRYAGSKDRRAIADHVGGFVSSGLRLATGRLFWGHYVLIRRFLDATLGGCPPPVDLEDALQIEALTDAILAAVEQP